MKKWAFVAALLVGATILGATVFRDPVAWAAQSVDATIAGPLDNGNVRVHEEGTAKTQEQNTDAHGNIKVHEQGTADVHVTNTSLPVASAPPINDGGGSHVVCAGECGPSIDFIPQATATALSIHMGDSVQSLTLGTLLKTAAVFIGPAQGGDASVVLPLDRPITFDTIDCNTGGLTDQCMVSWVGNTP
jgi:hypothetical protein